MKNPALKLMRESTETDKDQPDNADGQTGKEGDLGVQPNKSDKVRLMPRSATPCNAVAVQLQCTTRTCCVTTFRVPGRARKKR